MKAESFVYWLQGYFEIHGKDDGLTGEQVQIVRNHLNLVFAHDIDPKAGPPAKQEILNTIHNNSYSDKKIRC
jgi:hypothetical protein